MAVPLAVGVLFVTFTMVILAPVSYKILDDVQRTLRLISGSGARTALPADRKDASAAVVRDATAATRIVEATS